MGLTSVTEIWNLALSRMGENSVDSETEVSALGDICRAAWPIQRDRMLEDFDWDFARRHVVLTPINDASELVDNWTCAYEWPQGDMLSFRGITNQILGGDPIPYTTMLRNTGLDRKILTDLGSAKGFMTIRIVDVSRYSSAFVYAMSWAIQAEIEGSIGKRESKMRLAAQFFQNADDIARVAVAKQEEIRTPEASSPRSIAARA